MRQLNAGGTSGGAGRFFLGLAMMMVGFYLFFDAIQVVNAFSFRMALFNLGGMQLRSGMVLVPFVFGVGLIFYDSRKLLGWVRALGSLAMFGYGVLTATHFRLRSMTGFDIVTILTLGVGGLGLFLSSLRPHFPKDEKAREEKG